MIRIKTITFHRALNHGSVLQAYALQQFVVSTLSTHNIDCKYEIIDYHSEMQRELYSIFHQGWTIKSIVKNLIALRYYRSLKKREAAFNKFLDEHFSLTGKYLTEEDLKVNPPCADLFISGSDQIWNVRSKDFASSYYFDFLPDNSERVSFAASFGPLKIDWGKYHKQKFSTLLTRYKYISVREEGSADNVEYLTGKRPLVLADPTFLLNRNDWSKVENKNIKEKKPYILLYALEPTKEQLRLVKDISNKLSLPVIVLRYNNKNDWFNNFEKRYAAGPAEFLSYISQASLVLTSSFHGTAFSLIYRKPFYVLNGESDARIKSILVKTKLLDRIINLSDQISMASLKAPDFTAAEKLIEMNTIESKRYILNSITPDEG